MAGRSGTRELDELYERGQLDEADVRSDPARDRFADRRRARRQRRRAASRRRSPTASSTSAIAMIKQQNSIDDAGLDKALAEQHFTRASYREEIARQLRVAKVVQRELAAHVQISDDEIKAMYDQAKKVESVDRAVREGARSDPRGIVFEKKAADAQSEWLVKASAAHDRARREAPSEGAVMMQRVALLAACGGAADTSTADVADRCRRPTGTTARSRVERARGHGQDRDREERRRRPRPRRRSRCSPARSASRSIAAPARRALADGRQSRASAMSPPVRSSSRMASSSCRASCRSRRCTR